MHHIIRFNINKSKPCLFITLNSRLIVFPYIKVNCLGMVLPHAFSNHQPHKCGAQSLVSFGRLAHQQPAQPWPTAFLWYYFPKEHGYASLKTKIKLPVRMFQFIFTQLIRRQGISKFSARKLKKHFRPGYPTGEYPKIKVFIGF